MGGVALQMRFNQAVRRLEEECRRGFKISLAPIEHPRFGQMRLICAKSLWTDRALAQFDAIQVVVEVVEHLDRVGDHDFCPLLSHHVRTRFHHGIFLYDKSFSPRWFPTLWHAKIVSARYWNKSWYDTQPGRKGWSRSRPKQQPGQTYVSLVLSERLNSSDASPFDRGIRDGRRHFGLWHSPSTRAGAIPRIKARDSRIAASRSIVSGMSVVQTKIDPS